MKAMITLHELSSETQYLMQDFLFIERVNKTKALLIAVGVLPTLRQKQHELLHNNRPYSYPPTTKVVSLNCLTSALLE